MADDRLTITEEPYRDPIEKGRALLTASVADDRPAMDVVLNSLSGATEIMQVLGAMTAIADNLVQYLAHDHQRTPEEMWQDYLQAEREARARRGDEPDA